MRKVVFFVIGFLALVWSGVAWGWIYRFSPQARVDPQALDDHYRPSETAALFDNRRVIAPLLGGEAVGPREVLGETTGEKRVEVDLTNQRLYAYEGDRQVFNFLISSGKWARTPTGTFRIWVKLRYTKMEGGSKALRTYYYLPNVPYVMYFANDEIPQWRGFGLHGTYWHNNFGHPMSHGCINMRTEDAEKLYYWINPDLRGKRSIYATDDNPGTPVIIYGEAPWE